MNSAKATRWTREAILGLGNIVAHDDDGGTVVDPDGTDGGSDQDQNDDSKDDGAGGDDDKDDVDPKVLKQRLKNKREEQERDFKARKAAEKRADDLQKIVDEAARKGKTELENAKADVESRDKTIEKLTETNRRLVIENSFMTLKGIEWNNPSVALRLVDLSKVEFDEETGRPKDLKQLHDAAKDLAKSDPYLVRSKTAVSDETPNGRPTGKPPIVKTPDASSDDALKGKYNIHT